MFKTTNKKSRDTLTRAETLEKAFKNQAKTISINICSQIIKLSNPNQNKNLQIFITKIIDHDNGNKLLVDIFRELKNDKKINFQQFDIKCTLLEKNEIKTVLDFKQKVYKEFNKELILYFYQDILKSYNEKELDNEDDVLEEDSDLELLQQRKEKENSKILKRNIQWQKFEEFFAKYFPEIVINNFKKGEKHLDIKKFVYFVSLLTSPEETVKAEGDLKQYFMAPDNQPVIDQLIAYKEIFPIFYNPANESSTDYFARFLLDHRIVRGKLKISYVLHQNDTIRTSRVVEYAKISVVGDLIVKSGGTRLDYKYLPLDKGSYEDIVIQLKNFEISNNFIVDNIKKILKGENLADLTDVQKIYMVRLTELLFNCEGERNISAFLTNAMFFELVKKNIYDISDLPIRMPMAMKGAVQASRYTLDKLGGKYQSTTKAYLIKRQYLDYKTTSYKEKDNRKKRHTNRNKRTTSSL